MFELPPGFGRRIPVDVTQPCWPWPGALRSHGYGEVMIDSESKYPHRLAYQLHVGPIPRGWELDHVCHSEAVARGECDGGSGCHHRACWNPAHLEAVTSRENSMRGNNPMFAVHRSNVCRKGHDLSDATNVYINPNSGKRRCRSCDRARARTARSQPAASLMVTEAT